MFWFVTVLSECLNLVKMSWDVISKYCSHLRCKLGRTCGLIKMSRIQVLGKKDNFMFVKNAKVYNAESLWLVGLKWFNKLMHLYATHIQFFFCRRFLPIITFRNCKRCINLIQISTWPLSLCAFLPSIHTALETFQEFFSIGVYVSCVNFTRFYSDKQLHSEDGGTNFLRNVGIVTQNYTTSQPIWPRLES